jgi:hypothetical protein
VVAATAAALSAFTAPAALASWGAPFRVSAPTSLDLEPPQIAFEPRGGAAIGSTRFDAQDPSVGSAFVATGRLTSTRAIPQARKLLDLGFSSRGLDMLIGLASARTACCRSAALVRLAGGRTTSPRTVISDLTADASGKLVEVNGGTVSVVATRLGLWVARGRRRVRHLTDKTARIHTFDATRLADGGSAATWVNTEDPNTASRIVLASGSARGMPGHARTARTVAGGHTVDELAIATGRTGATLAWAEGWADRTGVFHSVVVTSDIGAGRSTRVLSSGRMLASGLSLAADPNGDQVAVWSECPPAGGQCVARAARRPARGRFHFLRLGPIDAGESPQAAVGTSGAAVIGWVRDGHVVARTRSTVSGRLGRALRISGGDASELALAFGPAGQAIAAWTQGGVDRSVHAAIYTA